MVSGPVRPGVYWLAIANVIEQPALHTEGRTLGGEPTVVFIQYLRGIAPLLVVWAHLAGFWLYAHQAAWRPQTYFYNDIAVPLSLYQNGGHLGVVIFFFVSGYIVSMTSARESVMDFAIKRAFRLLPALWLSVLVVVLAQTIAMHAGTGVPTGTGGSSVMDYIDGAFLLDMVLGKTPVNGVTWTLVIEFIFYFLTAALIPLSRRRPAMATLVMLAVWAGGTLLLDAFSFGKVFTPQFSIYIGILILGRSIYLAHRGLVTRGGGWVLCLATTVVWLAVYQRGAAGLLQLAGGPANTYLVGLLVFLVLMFANPVHCPAPVRFFADISYSLYLLHIPVGMLVIDLVLKTGGDFTVAFLTGVLASVGAAYLSYRVVERPSRRLARVLVTWHHQRRGRESGTRGLGTRGELAGA